MPRLQQLLTFLKESPEDSFLLFAIAKEYEQAGQKKEAFAYYQKLVNKDPEYVGVYYHLGSWYESEGQFHQAWKTYTSGMEVAKRAEDQLSWNELAAARANLGEEEDFQD